MKLLSLICVVCLFFVVGCGGGSTEVTPYEGEVTTPPALGSGSDEAAPAAPGVVD